MNGMLKFFKKNKRFSVGKTLKAPPHIVWRVITDTSLWGPSVVDVKCSDRFILYGSKGSVKTVMGLSLDFTITSLKKEREWTWSVGGINATEHRIIPIDDDPAQINICNDNTFSFLFFSFTTCLQIGSIIEVHDCAGRNFFQEEEKNMKKIG